MSVLIQRTSATTAKITLLTRTETKVFDLVCQGLRNKEIAAKLRISERTVKFHVSNILSKLAVRDRYEILRLYGKRST